MSIPLQQIAIRSVEPQTQSSIPPLILANSSTNCNKSTSASTISWLAGAIKPFESVMFKTRIHYGALEINSLKFMSFEMKIT